VRRRSGVRLEGKTKSAGQTVVTRLFAHVVDTPLPVEELITSASDHASVVMSSWNKRSLRLPPSEFNIEYQYRIELVEWACDPPRAPESIRAPG